MEKQDEFIKYRINKQLKDKFSNFVNTTGRSQSEIVREFIKLMVGDSDKPTKNKKVT